MNNLPSSYAIEAINSISRAYVPPYENATNFWANLIDAAFAPLHRANGRLLMSHQRAKTIKLEALDNETQLANRAVIAERKIKQLERALVSIEDLTKEETIRVAAIQHIIDTALHSKRA